MIYRASRPMLYTLSLIIGLAVMAGTATAYDRHVVLVNNTSKTIVEFYGSNTGTEDWEEDILGTDTLSPGQQVRINFDDGTEYCKFDFKMVFEDESEMIESEFNVCEYGTLTVSD